MNALASAQTTQPAADSQSTASQTTSPAPPAKPVKQSAVAAAASASKQARDSAPPTKVIRNHDLNDGSNPPDAAKSESKPSNVEQQTVAQAKETQEEEQKIRQFETQGKVFQNQIKVQKGKIIGIKNHIASLKNQFAAWSTSFAQDSDAPACWTSTYYTPYYKSWCDTGRNLKAQYDAAQTQLAQEKARLEDMQENIRRKGYGNAVYDPD